MQRPGDLATSPAGPDWSTISEDILCPLCDYNLRGLIEPRCPECGYRFAWPEVLDPTRRKHPYLFEHHPERNIRSFFRTLFGGLRPRRFWATVHPTQPSRARRLVIYGVLTMLPLVLNLAMPLAARVVDDYRMNRFWRARLLVLGKAWTPPSLAHRVRSAWNQYEIADPIVRLGFIYLLWPTATMGTLMIFRTSMRRARVRPIHVVRCAAYSFDALGWPLLLFWVGLLVWTHWFRGFHEVMFGIYSLSGLLGVMLAAHRLAVAYRLYLRFDHPRATVLASQVIVFLLALWFIIDDDFLLMLVG